MYGEMSSDVCFDSLIRFELMDDRLKSPFGSVCIWRGYILGPALGLDFQVMDNFTLSFCRS